MLCDDTEVRSDGGGGVRLWWWCQCEGEGGGVINAALCQLFCLLRPPWLPSDGRPIASLYAPFPRSTTSQNITGLCELSFMCRGEMFCGVSGDVVGGGVQGR